MALFIPYFAGGGAERVMLTLAKEFLERDLPVDLVVCNRSGPMAHAVPEGVRLIDLGLSRVLLSSARVAAYLRSAQPRVFMSTLIHANVACAVAHWWARSSTPLVLRVETTLTQFGPQADLPVRLALAAAPVCFRRASRIVAISNAVAEDLRQRLPACAERIATIWNPTDIALVQARARDPAPHPWLEDDAVPVIVSVGRLSPQKGMDRLMRSFEALRRERRCRLIILGEGPLRSQLTELSRQLGIEEDLVMPGFVPNPHAWVARARVLALASAYEGFGNVLVEALAVGTPVVSTDCPGGPREILADGRYGVLVPVGDDAAMSRALRQALEGHADEARLKARAQEFSVSSIADEYLRVMGVTGTGKAA